MILFAKWEESYREAKHLGVVIEIIASGIQIDRMYTFSLQNSLGIPIILRGSTIK